MKTVAWFSAGVSSAVAVKLFIAEIDEIIYTHIDDQHPDSMRFLRECEEWFGKPITVLQSPYKTVETACLAAGGRGYVNGPGGAACTRILKRRVRKEWESSQTEKLRYVWGLDCVEKTRASRLLSGMPDHEHAFPLIDNELTKRAAHEILKASGIKRPHMYTLGYRNNNCLGCVKGGKGYWNKIRIDFPEVFAARSRMERTIGGTCLKGIFLDELPPDAGKHEKEIPFDCGIMCELLAI